MTAGRPTSDDRPGLHEASSVDSVRDLYDRWASVYDWNPVLDLVRPARERAVAAMDLSRGDTVVDMGTGTGANLRYLRDGVGPDGRVIGLDISPRMLRRAQYLVDGEGWENVTLVEADIRDPPLDGPVDGILSAFVVVMYADPDRLVAEWSRYLDTGVMANLYAGRSSGRYAGVVNRLLSLYLHLFEDGWETTRSGSHPLDVLDRRGDRVRAALQDGADAVAYETFVCGLVHLDVGWFGSGPDR